MKFFVTGVGGQLGHDVMNELLKRGHEGVGSDIQENYSGVADGSAVTKAPYVALDITDKNAVEKVITEVNPDAVIHCAAWTAVDMAEDDDKVAKVRAINAGGTQNIANVCKKLDCKMTYISTDYVFDGQGTEPWQPDCKDYKPLNVYGQTKLEGELAVSQTLEKYFIVRIAWVFGLNGGYFMETYNEKDMKEAGIDIHFVQDNQSMSTKGVLRGLHFQKQYPQCKLVRAVRGTVFDVAVDLRSNSETYGKWYGVTLSAENKKQFLIPEGFAHGFLVLSDEAEFCYKVNDFWHPNDEGGMAWNDPEIGIEWPELKGEYRGSASAEGYTLEDGTALNLSDKDQKWLGLKDTFKF